jgi:hypothetical protein
VPTVLLSAVWDVIEMVASYEEFAAEHRAQHLSPFIRWSAVVGNYSLVPTAIALLFSRIKRVGSEAVFDDDARPSGHAALNDFPQRVRHLENRDVACEQAQVRRGEFRRKLSPYLAPLVDTQQH